MSTANFPDHEVFAPQLSRAAHEDLSGHRGHVVQFYADDAFLLEELSRLIGSALAAGDGAVVVATKAHRDGLTQLLKARGLDTAPAQRRGRYIVLDAVETLSKFMVKGRPDPVQFTRVMGGVLTQVTAATECEHPRVVAFGEMVALLWQQGKAEAAILLEELWNDLSRTHSFALRCAYPMQHFDREEHGESFLKICAAHDGVIPGENYTALASDGERSRTIARLQQKAQALTREIVERRRVEEELLRGKAELESLVQQRTAALRQLSARLLSLQDSERWRLARELHDCLGQYLVALKLNSAMLKQSPDRKDLWSEADELMQQCISEVRTLSYVLHPPTMDAAGLASAAQWFVEGFSQRSGIRVTLEASEDLARLPDMIELTLFRALQEALTNVHRHSGSLTADVSIHRSGPEVMLEVKDAGCGIKQNLLDRFRETGTGLGVGLTSMCERVRDLGGSLHIDSNDRGTALRVNIPISPDWVSNDC